jgi:hypothetical protein
VNAAQLKNEMPLQLGGPSQCPPRMEAQLIHPQVLDHTLSPARLNLKEPMEGRLLSIFFVYGEGQMEVCQQYHR